MSIAGTLCNRGTEGSGTSAGADDVPDAAMSTGSITKVGLSGVGPVKGEAIVVEEEGGAAVEGGATAEEGGAAVGGSDTTLGGEAALAKVVGTMVGGKAVLRGK